MEKNWLLIIPIYLCGVLLALGLGALRFRSNDGGGVTKRKFADFWAVFLLLIGIGVIAYYTVRLGYGSLLASAVYGTGNHGQTFFLNEWAAGAAMVALIAAWTLAACESYNLGACWSANHFLQQVPADPENEALDQLLYSQQISIEEENKPLDQTFRPQPPRPILDARLCDAFQGDFLRGGVRYRRIHKNPRAAEVHSKVNLEVIDLSKVEGTHGPSYTAMTVTTDELVHPHLWASEIASAMKFAGWQKQLHPLSDDEASCSRQSFAVPGKTRPGYAAELKFAAEAKASPDQSRDYVVVDDIISVLKDAGLKLQRDPQIC